MVTNLILVVTHSSRTTAIVDTESIHLIHEKYPRLLALKKFCCTWGKEAEMALEVQAAILYIVEIQKEILLNSFGFTSQ